jgi:hypothetical protein
MYFVYTAAQNKSRNPDLIGVGLFVAIFSLVQTAGLYPIIGIHGKLQITSKVLALQAFTTRK